jgi:hypothetical protein
MSLRRNHQFCAAQTIVKYCKPEEFEQQRANETPPSFGNVGDSTDQSLNAEKKDDVVGRTSKACARDLHEKCAVSRHLHCRRNIS